MTPSSTLAHVVGLSDADVLAHLDQQADVPILTGLQFQGDVAIVPYTGTHKKTAGTGQVPPQGVPVVRGENGGNTHLLLAEGDVTWAPSARTDATNLTLGIVEVGKKAIGWLLHPEHGANGLAPGRYELRRQREQADELRMVAD